ncbi:MAG: RNA polymerase sigma factor [Planctomycetota bacterium]
MKGDRRAFRELMRRDSRWVRGAVYAVIGNSSAVEDVTQDVWLAVWQRVDRLEHPEAWKSWLFRLARNAAIDFSRRRRTGATALERLRDERSRAVPETSPEENRLDGEEEYARVLRAIEALPEIYRQTFVLKHIEDWSYREIAEALSTPVDTIETRLVRARRLLRQSLKAHASRHGSRS